MSLYNEIKSIFTYLVFLGSEAFEVTPCDFVHCIYIAKIRGCLIVLLCGYRIFLYSPAVSKAICKLEYGQSEFSFGSTSFLTTSSQRQRFDFSTVRSSIREICCCKLFILDASPTMSKGEAIQDLTESVVRTTRICQSPKHLC